MNIYEIALEREKAKESVWFTNKKPIIYRLGQVLSIKCTEIEDWISVPLSVLLATDYELCNEDGSAIKKVLGIRDFAHLAEGDYQIKCHQQADLCELSIYDDSLTFRDNDGFKFVSASVQSLDLLDHLTFELVEEQK